VYLDCNAADQLTVPGGMEALREAHAAGWLRMGIVHVQADEILRTGNEERRAQLAQILTLTDDIGAGALVIGQWKLGSDRIGADGQDFAAIAPEPDPKRPVNHLRDGMLLTACITDGRPIVTSDKALRRRATENGVAVMHGRELLAEVQRRLGA